MALETACDRGHLHTAMLLDQDHLIVLYAGRCACQGDPAVCPFPQIRCPDCDCAEASLELARRVEACEGTR